MKIPFSERISFLKKENNDITSELNELLEISNKIKESSFQNFLMKEIANAKIKKEIRLFSHSQNRENIEMKKQIYRVKEEYDRISQKLYQVMDHTYFKKITIANEDLDKKIKLIKNRIKSNEFIVNKEMKVFFIRQKLKIFFQRRIQIILILWRMKLILLLNQN